MSKITFAIQVNGKLRGTIEVDKDLSKEDVQALAKQQVANWITSEPKKIIFVPGRLVNFIL